MTTRAGPLLIFAIALMGATCKGNSRESPQQEPRPQQPAAAPSEEAPPPAVTDVEGLDLGGVRPEVRADIFRLLNETFCYCGCPRTVASCLASRADCSCVRCSERTARFIVDQYRNGLGTEEVELELLDGFSEGFNGQKREIDLADHPAKGAADAKYTLIEFADFRCGHCKAAVAPLEQLLAERKDVRLVYFYYPLGTGDGANVVAAEAAEEARAQGKFWEMHDILFKNQMALEEENLIKYAEQIGLDVERFKVAIQKRVHRDRVLADKKLGQAMNVEATPTIFVNGRPFGLSRTLENFKMRLEMEQDRGRCD
jgi:hypothetical protein